MVDFGDIKSFKYKTDFSVENRDKICITNKDYITKNSLVLFYKKIDKREKYVYELFNKIGNEFKNVNLNFIHCNIENIPGLEKAFHDVSNDSDHPYHWIKNKPSFNFEKDEPGNKYPFILLYRKGFPQSFYEGNLEEKEFRDFCIQISVKTEAVQNIDYDPEEVKKQQWITYRKKDIETLPGKAVLDAFASCTELDMIKN
jgi:hypothetical protein